MKNHFFLLEKDFKKTKRLLEKDLVLKEDIDFKFDFIMPYSKAENVSDIKLVVIGQDPTVRNEASRKGIKATLNLDKKNSLRTYLEMICNTLQIDIDKEVYATNLYKCFFKFPPADDKTILTRQFKIWNDLLINELKPFENQIFITLGEPVINQLIHTGDKHVKYYWDYIGNTKSNMNFRCCNYSENYLQKRIYPVAHQPTWSRNKFYKQYLTNYLEFINKNENSFK